jgi:hypothetical protein
MYTVRTQDSSSGVIKSGRTSRGIGEHRKIAHDYERPARVVPKWKRRAQLSPLCTVLSWHAGGAHNMTPITGETSLST